MDISAAYWMELRVVSFGINSRVWQCLIHIRETDQRHNHFLAIAVRWNLIARSHFSNVRISRYTFLSCLYGARVEDVFVYDNLRANIELSIFRPMKLNVGEKTLSHSVKQTLVVLGLVNISSITLRGTTHNYHYDRLTPLRSSNCYITNSRCPMTTNCRGQMAAVKHTANVGAFTIDALLSEKMSTSPITDDEHSDNTTMHSTGENLCTIYR